MTFIRKITAAAAAVGLGTIVTLSFSPLAAALPPGGASSDTPGTSSNVSPSTLAPCETISWSVSGFAPNETVYVKIDDGALSGGDASVQGQGVVNTARTDGSGNASNSFAIPCDYPAGSHWLRFLASEAKHDASGNEIGSIGYTNRSPDFTVQAKSGSGSGSGNTSGGTTGGGAFAWMNDDNQSNSGQSGQSGSGVIGGGAQQAAPQTVRRTVVREAPGAAPAGAANQPQSAGQAQAQGQNRGPAAAGPAQTSGVQLPSSNDVLKAGGSGDGAAAGDSADDTVYVTDDTAYTQTGVQSLAQGSNGAPIVGLAVGGSILVVGLAAIAAYLYVNRPRTV